MPKKREKSEISKHLSLVNVFFLVFITANLMIAILYLSNDEGVYSSPRSPTPRATTQGATAAPPANLINPSQDIWKKFFDKPSNVFAVKETNERQGLASRRHESEGEEEALLASDYEVCMHYCMKNHDFGYCENQCFQHSDAALVDINSLVQAVLSDAYMENTEDLHFYAQKVRYFNEVKKAMREELTRAREALTYAAGEEDDFTVNYASTDVNAEAFGDVDEITGELGAGGNIATKADLDTYIQGLEEKLNSVYGQ